MTKTAFAREIGVSLSSLSGFLGANGPTAGSRSAAYSAAWEYFRKREMSGMEMPAKKQKTTDAHAEMEGPTKPAAGKKTKAPAGPVDEITVYLKRLGMTQALLCRQIYAECKGPERPERCFQASQLAQFRKAKGPLNGARKPIFYGAYVFFEKLRIKEGKPKSKHRQDMELIWQGEGLPRERDIGRQKVWVPAARIRQITYPTGLGAQDRLRLPRSGLKFVDSCSYQANKDFRAAGLFQPLN
ncbi:hypothetical protein N656DRAFT_765118 [Canariomyces notabilis]|uniref:DUF7726 domain-containing protein n=1 Tax=Canariomyces notabilis TaxID=2074819 RepID=A0AAN6TKG6_9PEZI|nr:hypothetical protein N656DRAFT_765118 [Canariomyces arenarius]